MGDAATMTPQRKQQRHDKDDNFTTQTTGDDADNDDRDGNADNDADINTDNNAAVLTMNDDADNDAREVKTKIGLSAGVGTNCLELIALRSQLIGIAMEVYTWNCNSSELQPKELQSLRIAASLVTKPLSPRSY